MNFMLLFVAHAGVLLLSFYFPIWFVLAPFSLLVSYRSLHARSQYDLWPTILLAVLVDVTTPLPGSLTVALLVGVLVCIIFRHIVSRDTWLSHGLSLGFSSAVAIMIFPVLRWSITGLLYATNTELMQWYAWDEIRISFILLITIIVAAALMMLFRKRQAYS
jgi:hypothetical protein